MKYQQIKSIANSSRAGFYEELNSNNGVDVKRYLALEEFFKGVKMSHRKLSIAEDNFNECKKNMRVFCLSCGTYKDLVEGDVFCISCDLEKNKVKQEVIMNRRTKVQVYELFGKIPSVWEVAVVAGLGIAVIGLLGAIALGLNLVLGIFIR